MSCVAIFIADGDEIVSSKYLPIFRAVSHVLRISAPVQSVASRQDTDVPIDGPLATPESKVGEPNKMIRGWSGVWGGGLKKGCV